MSKAADQGADDVWRRSEQRSQNRLGGKASEGKDTAGGIPEEIPKEKIPNGDKGRDPKGKEGKGNGDSEKIEEEEERDVRNCTSKSVRGSDGGR